MMEITNLKDKVVNFNYKNWRGVKSRRKVVVAGIQYGSNDYHKEEQFLLHCFDLEKREYRSFALKDITGLEVIG